MGELIVWAIILIVACYVLVVITPIALFFVATIGVAGFAYALVPEERKIKIVERWLEKAASSNAETDDDLQPSSRKERTAPPPQRVATGKYSWDDIILPADTLQQIRLTLEILTDEKKRRLISAPPRGMLLFGPPGTGKTQVARVVASVGGFSFYQLGTAEARGKFIGHGPARIKEVFEAARENNPSIVFIDELDALAPDRAGLGGDSTFYSDGVNELLQQIDGLDERRVFVIGATNRPEQIDPAILRRLGVDPATGRWAIEIPLPDSECRGQLLRMYLKKVPLESGFDLTEIVRMSEGLSGDGLQTLCTQAGITALKRGRQALSVADFSEAMSHAEPV